MAACRFVVKQVALEPSLRGAPMRRLVFMALPSDAFAPVDPSAQTTPPDGLISLLVNPDYAARFSPGDEFDLSFRERE
jgi:hypothetical protein